MRLERKNSKATVESFIGYRSVDKYIGMLIDIYSVTTIDPEFRLTKTERRFFIATVIHVNSGYINPICDESVQIYKDFFSPKANKIQIPDYINRLRIKGWLSYDKEIKKVEFEPIFQNIDLNTDTFDFKIRLAHERKRD